MAGHATVVHDDEFAPDALDVTFQPPPSRIARASATASEETLVPPERMASVFVTALPPDEKGGPAVGPAHD
jgi:hypothetical protein